jgi:hypothetical protein
MIRSVGSLSPGPPERRSPHPKVMITIRTRVTEEQFQQLRRLAAADYSNVSQVVRRMVCRELAQQPDRATRAGAREGEGTGS